jgi:hypothetical protein
MYGTASWANNAISSSYSSHSFSAISASYALNAATSLNATSASYSIDASIRISGSTLYSTNRPAGPNFSRFDNIFLGTNSGFASAGQYIIGIGENAGYNTGPVFDSNFIGRGTGQNTTNASFSNFLGYTAGLNATNASSSNFLGPYAGFAAAEAAYSNFLGEYAGSNAGFAAYSTLIGFQAGRNLGIFGGIGRNNIIIGTNITLPQTVANAINIGGIIFGSGSYFNTTVQSSGSANGKIGINVPNPTYTLDVSGSGNYTNGLTVTGSVNITNVLTLPLQHPLPSSPLTGSLAVSGSGIDCKIYFYNGTWNALF